MAGGLNLYGFADSDPVSFGDPFGLCPTCPVGAATAIAFGGIRLVSNLAAGRKWYEGVGSDATRGAILGLTLGLAAPALATLSTDAAATTLPTLAAGSGQEMYRQAIGHLRSLTGNARADAFARFAQQISESTRGSWSAVETAAANGRVFVGDGGAAIAFDAAGNMFRGSIGNAAQFALQRGGQYLINFDNLRRVQ